jgi:hypothetical protein
MTQNMLTGAAIGSGGALIGVGRAAGEMAVGATTAGAGAVVASAAAGSLASQQVAAASGGASGGRVARLAVLTGRTARNLGSAAASDIGGRLSGTRTNRGSMPFRMAADLRNRSDSAAPAPAAPPAAPGAPSSRGGDGNTIEPS